MNTHYRKTKSMEASIENTVGAYVGVPRVSPPRSAWMVFEDNQTWAVPKRPKFVIEGSFEEVETLIQEIESACTVMGESSSRDTRMVAQPIRLFSSVGHYRACERAIFEAQMRLETERRSRRTLLCATQHAPHASDLDAKYQKGFKNLPAGEPCPPCPACDGKMKPWDCGLVTGATCESCGWNMSEGSGSLL